MRRLIVACMLAAALWPASALAEPSVLAEYTHSRKVRAVAVQGARVWVATSGGLWLHDRRSGRMLAHLGARDGLPGSDLHDLTSLPDGGVLIAGQGGAAVARLSAVSRSPDDAPRVQLEPLPLPLARPQTTGRYDPAQVALPPTTTQAAAVLSLQSGVHAMDGSPVSTLPSGMWSAAARGAGGLALGSLSGRLRVVGASGDGLELGRPVLQLLALGEGFIAATGEGLYRLEGGRLQPLLHHGRPVAATAMARGPVLRAAMRRGSVPAAPGARYDSLLIGTANGAVLRYAQGVFTQLAQLPARVSALAELAPGAEYLWAGVAGHGLWRISRATGALEALRPADEICSNHVTRLTRHRGLLVVGSFDGGACYLKDGHWHDLPIGSPYVHGLVSDGRALWVAHSNGLSRFDRALSPWPIGDADPEALREASGRAVTQAVVGDTGAIWLASAPGVIEVRKRGRGHTARRLGAEHGVPGHINAMLHAGGALHVGSETEGVAVLQPGRPHETLTDPAHLPEAWVTALAAGPGALWVGTCQGGVSRLETRDHQPSLEASGHEPLANADEDAPRIGARDHEPPIDGRRYAPRVGVGEHVQGIAAGTRWLGRAQGLPGDRIIALATRDDGAFVGTLSGLAFAGDDGTVATLELPLPDTRISALHLEGARLWVATQHGLSLTSP